jgi:hypothetical protein
MWLVLAVGCVGPDLEATGEVEQHSRCLAGSTDFECAADCGGCGHNGLREGSWDLLFGQFNRSTLDDYGLWVWPASGVTSGALSLCIPSQTYSDHCVMRWKYSNWIAGEPHSRVDIMSHVVAAVAQTNYRVIDPGQNGNTYWGSFNLRPQALTDTWDFRTQETITAALLAQLNAEPGVAICLLNEQTPTNCSSSGGKYHEGDFYGNHFQYYFAGISGGAHANDPKLNRRYGTVEEDNGDEPPAETYLHEPVARCDYSGLLAGAGNHNSHATRCQGKSGTWWNYPVTVRTPLPPGTWYYPPGSLTRPSNWPQVPMEN